MRNIFYKAFLMSFVGFAISLAHAMDTASTWRTSAENPYKDTFSSSMTCYPLEDNKTSTLKNFTLKLKKEEQYTYVLTYIFKKDYKVNTKYFYFSDMNKGNEKDTIFEFLKEVSDSIPDPIFSALANHFYFPNSSYFTGSNLFKANR